MNAMREEARNKLLRRADWRFLLPNPQPTRSICFARGQLAEAVGLISECVVDSRAGLSGDCDLAVAIDPDDATLREAAASLYPGGSCYTEWYSPLTGGLEGVRRRLEAAGFNEVTCYWCWPWPLLSGPRYWLPLEATGALRYFFNSRIPARSLIRRAAGSMLRMFWFLGFRIGLTFPVCAITRKPGFPGGAEPTTAGGMLSAGSRPVGGEMPDLLDMIRMRWESWGFGITPDTLSLLILSGGPRSTSKVVALVFAEPDHHPWLAIKMPRVPEAVPGLIREATALESIQSLRPDVRGAPRLLFSREYAGLMTVGETALTGQLLPTVVEQSNYRELALKVTDWLAHLAGRSEPRPGTIWWGRLVEPILADFSDSFGPVIDRGMLRDTRDIVAAVGVLPLVCEHRDFAPWNLLVAPDGAIGVLDWEGAEVQGLPVLDLVYFLTFLAFFLDGGMRSGRLQESYRASLDPSTWLGSVRAECLARYVTQTGVDPRAVGALRLLVWLLHARSEYRRFAADAAGRPDPRALSRSVFVGLWKEELRYATRV